MDFCSTPTATKKLKELSETLVPYSVLWSEWIESGACFLNQKEITVIKNYLLTGSHTSSSVELGITYGRAAIILKKVNRRLKWNYKNYQGWLTERLLEQHGIITYSCKLERFLNTPMPYSNIPYNLKTKLSCLSKDTMGGLLNSYSLKDMKRFRNFGNKTLNDFKEVLKENNCLHLLRE